MIAAGRLLPLIPSCDRRRNPGGGGVKGRRTLEASPSDAAAMSEATTPATTAPDARAAVLLAIYQRAGYRRAEPSILQPAHPFPDLLGEDIRRRMYRTTDASGRELCL